MSLIRQENKSFSKLCKQKSAECQTLNFVCLVSCQVTVDIMGYIGYYCWGCFQVCLPDKQTRTHTQAHNYAGETNIRELSEEAYPSQDIVVHEHEHVPLGLMQESQDTNNFDFNCYRLCSMVIRTVPESTGSLSTPSIKEGFH